MLDSDTGALLAQLRALLPRGPNASVPGAILDELAEQQQRSLRIAVVGQIKAGKSTLLNALIGRDLLPTGTTEATYYVTWLR